MTESVTFVVPLPRKEVAANSRAGWAAVARARKSQRTLGWIKASEAASKVTTKPWGRVEVDYHFMFTVSRRRDLDNLIYSMKATLDGVQDSGLIEDDHGIVSLSASTSVTKQHQEGVKVTVRRSDGPAPLEPRSGPQRAEAVERVSGPSECTMQRAGRRR